MVTEVGANERYCTSCGSVVKEQADICTDCGVRNDVDTGRNSPGSFYCVSCGEQLHSDADRCPHCGVDYDSVSTTSSGTSNGEAIAWAAGIVFVLIGFGGLSDAGGAFDVVLGLAFLVGGVVLLPPVRGTVSKNHPLTTFGTVKDVDRHGVDSHSQPCISCGSPVEEGGTVSHYYEEFVLLGFTVSQSDGGENVYCNVCSPDATPATVPDATHDPSPERVED